MKRGDKRMKICGLIVGLAIVAILGSLVVHHSNFDELQIIIHGEDGGMKMPET